MPNFKINIFQPLKAVIQYVLYYITIPFFFLEVFFKVVLNFIFYKIELYRLNDESSLHSLVGSVNYDPDYVYNFFKKEFKKNKKSLFAHRFNVYFKKNGKLQKQSALQTFFNKRKFIERKIFPYYYYPSYNLRQSLRHLKITGEIDKNLMDLIKDELDNSLPEGNEKERAKIIKMDLKTYVLKIRETYKMSFLENFYLEQFVKTNKLEYIIKFIDMPVWLQLSVQYKKEV